MKRYKRCLAGGLCAFLLLGMVGCGDVPRPEYPDYPDYDPSDYVELGDYDQLTVRASLIDENPTDEEVTEKMEEGLRPQKVEDENATVAEGSYVVIDYTGTVDGESFPGSEMTDYTVHIGSGTLISGLEDAMVGMKAGEEKELKISFPEDYSVKEVAGKVADFTITVKEIQEIPEITDAVVSEQTAYDSVEAYRKAATKELQKEKQSNNENTKRSAILTSLPAVATVKEIPEDLRDWYVDCDVLNYTYYAKQADMDLDDYLSEQTDGEIEDENAFREYLANNATASLSNELILLAIAQDQGMKISDQAYQKALEADYETYSFDSPEEFERCYGKQAIKTMLLTEKALDYLLEHVAVENVSAPAQE